MDDIEYSICWVPFDKVYDICIQDIHHTHIINYEETKKLSDIQETYFNLLQGESIEDERGNEIKCVSHSIEYVF